MIDPRFLSINRKNSQHQVRICRYEPLEQRKLLSATSDSSLSLSNAGPVALVTSATTTTAGISYPGGVTVTSTQILTETETIPRFAAQATITNIKSGNWTDSTIWSPARVPTDHDRVVIAGNTTVDYSTLSNASLDALEVDGVLRFSTSANTRLTVANLTVMPTGVLQIGTATSPVPQGVTAELVIANRPLDLVNDPQQYGTGFIALGTVSIHGAPVNQTWVPLGAEPRAGDDHLTVGGDISGWRAGDTLVVPDTRQVLTSQATQFLAGQLTSDYEDEEVTIDHIVGNQVYLTNRLAFDHLGAHNTSGGLEMLPQVARLDHNVTIRSADPAGVRGYTLFTARATVDIEYATFQELGRTDAFSALDDTTFDPTGNVTHVGANQSGRYAVYFDHLMGPTNATNTGYQFQFVGNTVDASMKWAVAIDDSSYGLLSDNVVYDAEGAGFVTCAGSEIGNLFQNNITISIQGTYSDGSTTAAADGDYAGGGSGFWFRRDGNAVVGNVAADSSYAGFVIDGYYDTGNVTLPAFRGADITQPGQGILTGLNPSAAFSNNQAYGMTTYGIWIAFNSGNDLAPNQPLMTFSNLTIWNVFSVGVSAYHTSHVTFDNLLILGNESAQDRNDEGAIGMNLEYYENRDLVISNSRIEGVRYGIIAPNNDASQAGVRQPTIVQNTILKNYINILVTPGLDDRASNGNALEVRDVKFSLIPNLPTGPATASSIAPPANIQMRASGNTGENVDLTQTSVVNVYDYNQVVGTNFQVFYREQSPSFIMPQTSATLLSGRTDGPIGSPEAGLTNLQNWQKYGIAVAGGLAPSGATASHPEINGLVAPLQDLSAVAPRVVLVTPWDGARIVGNQPIRIRYNINGLLPAGAQVFFSLDGGTPVAQLTNGGLYNVSAGAHTLRAYIGSPDGTPLAGTGPAAVSSITVLTEPPSLDLNGSSFGTDFATYFVVGNGPVPIVDNANLTITDPSNSMLVSAVVTLSNPQSGDVLAANTSGTAITASSNGKTITFSGSDTLAHYQQVLRSVTFNNTLANPSTAQRKVSFLVTDATNSTSAAATSTVSVPAILDLNGPAAGFDFATTYLAGSAAVPIVDNAKLTVTDRSSSTILYATVAIVAPQSGDVLAASVAGTRITVQFDGVHLTLSGTDTLANYQQVLRTVTFKNTLANSLASTRSIKFSITDGISTSPIATSTVAIQESSVAARMVFYRDSPRFDVTTASAPGFSDDNAIATDKSAYLPGSGAATFANVTSYSKGINGIMLDLQSGGSHASISLANVLNDFTFKVGNNNAPSTWASAPTPNQVTVRVGAGVGGSDRVELMWGANAPKNTWMQVTVKATANTGLAAPDVFYFGNLAGDTGLGDSATLAKVDSQDMTGIQTHGSSIRSNLSITDVFDFDRDGRISGTDVTIIQTSATGGAAGLVFINVAAGASLGTLASSTVTGGAAVASAIASASTTDLTTQDPRIPSWLGDQLSQLDLNQGPVATYFEGLARENTPNGEAILIAAHDAADALGLDDHLLDALLSKLGLE